MSTVKNTTILVSAIVFATILLAAGPISGGTDNINAFATKNNKLNEAIQGIGQSTNTTQSSDCFSESGDSTASCNNVALSFNLNDGNNAAGQQ